MYCTVVGQNDSSSSKIIFVVKCSFVIALPELFYSEWYKNSPFFGVAQLLEHRASNRKVAKTWFDFRCGSASLCPWKRQLNAVSHLGAKVVHPLWCLSRRKTCKQNSFCVGVVKFSFVPVLNSFQLCQLKLWPFPVLKNSLKFEISDHNDIEVKSSI